MTETIHIRTMREGLEESPMSPAQVRAVAVIGVLSALDGYDVLAATFAAPGISAEFGVDKASLGVVLAAGLAGMGLGSLLLAPLADRAGRRPIILASLLIMALGMALTASASDLRLLAACRLATGLGIGAMVAVIAPLAAEFANRRRRGLALAAAALGYPVGGVIGGAAAAALLRFHDWRAVFILGAVAALGMLPAVLAWIPESVAWLLTRPGAASTRRLNAVLVRFKRPQITWRDADWPGRSPPPPRRSSIFRGSSFGVVLRLAASNILYVIAVYYLLSWMPQLVADAGFPAATATAVSVIMSAGGLVGGVLVGVAAPRWGLKPVVAIAFIGTGFGSVAFGLTPPELGALRLVAAILGAS